MQLTPPPAPAPQAAILAIPAPQAAILAISAATEPQAAMQAALSVLEGGAIYLLDRELDLLTLQAGAGPQLMGEGTAARAALDAARGPGAGAGAGLGEGTAGWAALRAPGGVIGVIGGRERGPGERALVAAVLGLALDRHRASLAAARAEGLMGALTELARAGVVVATTTGEFPNINQRMEELCGWTPEELRRLGWFDCLYPDPADRAKAVASARGAFQGQPAGGVPWRIWHRSGRPVEVRLRSRIVALEGQPSCILAVFQAIPEAERGEVSGGQGGARPEGAAMARPEGAAMARLAGVVAHDVNNFVAAIQGHAELLSMEPSGRVRERAAVILSTVERARRLTGQLAAFGREQPLRRAVCGLRGLAEEAGGGAEVCGDPALSVEVDPEMIRQLLRSLLDVAGGAGRVSVEEARPPASPTRSFAAPEVGAWARARLEVAGGAVEALRARLRDPFAHGASARQGLEVAMIERAVQLHGGALDLAEGRADLYLPLARPPADEPMRRDPAVGGSERVWVVDDDAAVRGWLEQALQNFGYAVRSFDGGETVLQALADGADYDLLICDLSMPGMDGLELFQRLRGQGVRRPVLLCSGYSARAAEVPGGRDVDFVQKPVPTRMLAQRVRRLLNYTVPEGRRS